MNYKRFGQSGLVGDDRVIFNIGGIRYRLVMRVVFDYKAIQIKWFGTQKEYDKIDVRTIKFRKS